MFWNILNVFTASLMLPCCIKVFFFLLDLFALGFGTEPQSFRQLSIPRLLSSPLFWRRGPVTYRDSIESSSRNRRLRITDHPYSIKRCQWTHTIASVWPTLTICAVSGFEHYRDVLKSAIVCSKKMSICNTIMSFQPHLILLFPWNAADVKQNIQAHYYLCNENGW